MNHHAKPRSQT